MFFLDFEYEKALSHRLRAYQLVAERTGLEPATPCVTGRYSNQLNYRSTGSFTSHLSMWATPLLAVLLITGCQTDNV